MAEAIAPPGLIDACVFHEWPSNGALTPYMPDDWGAILGERTMLVSPRSYRDPRGMKDPGAFSGTSGVACSDYETLKATFLDTCAAERVVLGYDDGLFSTLHPHHYIARAVAKSANDWTIEEWLARDDRLYGLILVATALPEAAAEEIRRVGTNERMVGVALGANGLCKPFGHPAYHPIYEAASELGLPLVLQAGPEASPDAVVQFVREGIAIVREAGHAHRSGVHASGTVAHLFRAEGGVPKTPVDEVSVGIRGIVGDGQTHRQHHGRPFQALSLFSVELVEDLRREGHPIVPGGVGENISTRGLDWDALQPGVQLRVGTVIAEVSCFADPCSQIAHSFAGRDFNRIDEDRIPGSGRRYAWVLEPGEIRVGDAIVIGSSGVLGSSVEAPRR